MSVVFSHGRVRGKGAGGFTLLEVLIALIIFAIAFGALASLFQTSLRQADTADDLRRAIALAEAQLARFGKDLPLEPGHVEGNSPDGLLWEAEISLARPPDDDIGLALYHIRIEAGGPDQSTRPVSLSTLKIGTP